MDFEEWLAFGHAQGWTGKIFCTTHGWPEMTEEEEKLEEEWDEPPCIFAIRFYDDSRAHEPTEVE